MTRDEAIEYLKNGASEDAIEIAIQSMEMLNKIEQLINSPLVKACGSIGTQKIKEVLDG